MKRILIIPFIFFYIIGYSQSTKTKIEEGTIILLKSLSVISSNTTSDGESIDFFCAENVVVDNKIIIILAVYNSFECFKIIYIFIILIKRN